MSEENLPVGSVGSGDLALAGGCNGPYVHSFGILPDKMPYTKSFYLTKYAGQDMTELKSLNMDYRKTLGKQISNGMAYAQLKALTTTAGGAGTAGNALIPVFVDSRIVDLTRKFTPWVELVSRVTNQGKEADFNRITDKESGFHAAEDGPLTAATDTESRASTAIKYIYSVGRVTGQMQAAMPAYTIQGLQPGGTGTNTATFNSPAAPTARQYEVLKRAQALREYEENMLWTGDASTNALEHSGIVKLQGSTNQNDKSSSAVNYDDFERTATDSYEDSGRGTIAGCDIGTLRDLRKIMTDHFRFKPGDLTGTVGFGVPAALVIELATGPVPVIPSQFLSSSSGAKQFFLLDMEYIETRVLQDMTFEELAKNNDSQKFMLKEYICVLLRGPQFNAFIDNIS